MFIITVIGNEWKSGIGKASLIHGLTQPDSRTRWDTSRYQLTITTKADGQSQSAEV